MHVASRKSRQKTWRSPRSRVSVLAEMALRRERIVERLAELREQHSLSQEDAAHRVGVTTRQWQRWESGESVPYPRNLDRVASAFRISVQEFFDGEPTLEDDRLAAIEQSLADLHDKLDLLLQRAGGMDPADLTEQIVRDFEAQTERHRESGQADPGSGRPSDAKRESVRARPPRKQQGA